MDETRFRRAAVGAGSVIISLFLWEGLVAALDVPDRTLPGPTGLLERAAVMASSEGLGNNVLVTVGEIVRGVLIGLALGVLVALMFSRNRLLERIFMPVIVIMQVTPKIAIAPLLVLWLGLGATSKVFLVALVTFFPVLVSTYAGLQSISLNVRHLTQLLALSPIQRFLKIEVPSVVPNIVSGVRLGCLAGVTAAVIGEIIGAKAGLGYLVVQSQESGDVAQGLTAVVVLALVGLTFWTGVGALAKRADAFFAA